MSSVNKVFMIGRLGKDPEMKQAKELSICEFSLATSMKVKGEEKTEWSDCVAFGKTAELCGKYLHKGGQVCIEGRLQTDSWADKKHGDKRYKTRIVVNQVTFLGSKADNSTVTSESEEILPF